MSEKELQNVYLGAAQFYDLTANKFGVRSENYPWWCSARNGYRKSDYIPRPYFNVTYPDGTKGKIVEPLSLAYFYEEQVRDLLVTSGFEIVEEMGNYIMVASSARGLN